MKGQVVKVISNRYTVKSGDKTYVSHARAKIKMDGEIYAGDYVEFTPAKPFSIITAVQKRKNSLIRPYVANIDIALIVVAVEPNPDLMLVDKVLINCYKENITPIICINKVDINDLSLNEYSDFVEIIKVSAATRQGLNQIDGLKGKLICLVGQSAVGKTSLLNSLFDLNVKTDKLSQRIKRGKNTTRHVEIYDLDGLNVVDTCGFSMLELNNIKSDELKYYYHEFIDYPQKCKYSSCNHIGENECAIKEGVNDGSIDKGRYLRYTHIYNELKEKEKNV